MEQDKTKLEQLRNYARTAVLESKEAEKQKPEIVEESFQFENAKINLFSSDVLSQINAKPQVTTAVELKTEVKEESVQEEKQEEDTVQVQQTQDIISDEVITENLVSEVTEIEASNKKEIENEIASYSQTKPKGLAFRVKLLTGTLCVLIALFGGWVIGNTISIASTSSQIAAEKVVESDYNVKIADYIVKISQLDNWNEDNANNEGNLIPIEEVVPITPQPLKEPTSYQKETNWFDKICNWILGLFGG